MRAITILLGAVLLSCGGGPPDSDSESIPATRYIVSQKAESSVAFYSAEGELISAVPVNQHPHELAFSNDGRTIYTTDNGTMAIEIEGDGGNKVSIIDVESRQKTGEIDLGKYYRPHGIDVNPVTDEILVTTENPDKLLVLNPVEKTVVREYDTGGETSHIVTVSLDGRRAFVSNARSGTVAAIDLASGESVVIESGERPEGSVLSQDGWLLYVANRDSNTIAIIDTIANKRVGIIETKGTPVRIGITGDGNHVVYGLMSGMAVGIADVELRKEVARVDLTGEPVSLHISADGNHGLACAQDEGRCYVVSVADRKIVKSFLTKPGAGPDPMIEIGGE